MLFVLGALTPTPSMAADIFTVMLCLKGWCKPFAGNPPLFTDQDHCERYARQMRDLEAYGPPATVGEPKCFKKPGWEPVE
jgi:hypothetical protein